MVNIQEPSSAESRAATIKSPPQPRGRLHKRYGRMPVTVYNKRGKVVAWLGGRFLPINGPVLWFIIGGAVVAGFLGGIIGGSR